MKRTAFFLLLFSISCFLSAQQKHNLLEFNAFAETTIEADYVKILMRIEKKDKSFEKASDSCNKTINRITAYLQEQGISSNDIDTAKFNIQLNSGFFNKEVTVSSTLSAKLKNQKIFQKVITKLQEIDSSIELYDISYGLENSTKEEFRKKLIKIASARANTIKAEYEKNLSIKLKLYSLDELQGDAIELMAQGPPGFADNIPPSYGQSYKTEDWSEKKSFPVFHYKLTLILKYEIL